MFVTNFVEISRPILKMLKKGIEIKWDVETSISFQNIKRAINNALMLRILDYSRPMHKFIFASLHTIATILL